MTATCAVAGWLGPTTAIAGPARVFTSEAQCESAAVLAGSGCRTAFSNALAEFAAKAPRFGSRRACFRAFGPCMPWPIGTHRFGEFRPQWIGIAWDPTGTVLPAVAPGRQHLGFTPQPTGSLTAAALAAATRPPAGVAAPGATIMTPDDADGGEAAPARAGGGFTVIDGVLTYPAPARFQPKALKQP